jgi:PhoPQ-activated pathogenicity-related protein
MDWQDRPEYLKLLAIEEPYEYRQRLTLPKFIVNATGDQFFLPDSSRFYFDDLLGQKHLRYVPNADHGLRGSDAIESIAAYYQSILLKRELPTVSWKFEDDGAITVQTDDTPAGVLVWQATNPDARDFRKDTIGDAWTSAAAETLGSGIYRAAVAEPAKGWAAFLVELTFPTGSRFPLKFTTGVRVVPDTLPHAPYQPKTDGLPAVRQ